MPLTTTDEISREQLRAFHLTGRGLEHVRPTGRIRPAELDAILPKMPRLEDAYPLYAGLNAPPRPLIDVLTSKNEAIVRDVIAVMGDRPLIPVADAPALAGAGLPDDGYLIGFHPDSPALLYGAFLTLTRRDARTAFFQDVKLCVARLQDLLASEPVSAETLGSAASRFLVPSALTEIFDRQGSKRAALDPERRTRCESTLAVLEKALEEEHRGPSFWLFHSAKPPRDLAVVGGRSCQSEDSCAAALECCDRQLGEWVAVLRAVRIARLEIESAFDSRLHSELLDCFDWQSAEPEELAALPAIAVIEPPENLSLTSFARLLRSGRPVQILARCSRPLAGALDFGYLTMAHRDAFVMQSSLAKWDHLAAGLVEMTRTARPAVAILSAPATGQIPSGAWIEIALYSFSRAFPLYRYDPLREGGWANRFQLFDPGAAYSGLTAIHAIAAANEFRDQFRLIPPSASDDAAPGLPVVDEEGNERRAVFSREVVNLCRDCGRAWEMLAELASAGEEKHAPESNMDAARREGAAQAYDVVLALLADPEKLASAAPSSANPNSAA